MRIVLDTNIWISGLLLPHSKAGNLLAAWQENKLAIITSSPLLEEIKKVLLYPKIQQRIKWNEHKVQQYIDLLIFFTESVVLPKGKINVPELRDKDDLFLLKTLLASQADYLVSGDNDLLCLKNNYPILTLAEFYELLEQELIL